MKHFHKIFLPLLVLIIIGSISASFAVTQTQKDVHHNFLTKNSQVSILNNHTTVQQKIYYVNVNGSDKNNGLTPNKAFKTIQKAVNMAFDNYKIIVANGTYKENVVIDKNIILIGNSSKNTIINCGKIGRCIYIKKSGEAIISGFTLKNGNNTDGGGVLNTGTLTILDSIISGNRALNGGGISNYGTINLRGSEVFNNVATYNGGGINNLGTLYVKGCLFRSNIAEIGGGINSEGELQLYESKIIKNTAKLGGGINNNHCVISLVKNIIQENKATVGGGIYNNNGIIDIFVTTITKNSAKFGGGISNYGLIKMYFTTIKDNHATLKGGGIYNYSTIYKDKNSSVKNNSPDDVNLNPTLPFPDGI